MTSSPEHSDAKHEFPCQQCGANLVFSPGEGGLKCEYCGHEQALGSENAQPVVEYDFAQAIASARRRPARQLVEGGHEVRCEGCGAHTVLSTEAGRCPFCDSPVVMVQSEEEIFTPENLLPFKIEEKQAREAFKSWVSSRWFAPNDLAMRARREGMDGVFLPYWTYDSETRTSYTGQRGIHYYVDEQYQDANGDTKTRRVRKTRWYPAFGSVYCSFDDVLVSATKALPRALIEKLEPWDLDQLVPYAPGYLSGYLANRYDIDLEPGFEIAEDRMEPVIRNAIARDIGGDEQRIFTTRIQHSDVRFKHFLLPLWISSFRYQDKVFRFLVNARTGEPAGERPYSWVKISLAVIAGLILVAIIVYLMRSK